MRASPNGVPSRRPTQVTSFLGCPGTVKSLLLEMYGPAVEATLLCGRQGTLPMAHKTILTSAGCPFVGAPSFAKSDPISENVGSTREISAL